MRLKTSIHVKLPHLLSNNSKIGPHFVKFCCMKFHNQCSELNFDLIWNFNFGLTKNWL